MVEQESMRQVCKCIARFYHLRRIPLQLCMVRDSLAFKTDFDTRLHGTVFMKKDPSMFNLPLGLLQRKLEHRQVGR